MGHCTRLISSFLASSGCPRPVFQEGPIGLAGAAARAEAGAGARGVVRCGAMVEAASSCWSGGGEVSVLAGSAGSALLCSAARLGCPALPPPRFSVSRAAATADSVFPPGNVVVLVAAAAAAAVVLARKRYPQQLLSCVC